VTLLNSQVVNPHGLRFAPRCCINTAHTNDGDASSRTQLSYTRARFCSFARKLTHSFHFPTFSSAHATSWSTARVAGMRRTQHAACSGPRVPATSTTQPSAVCRTGASFITHPLSVVHESMTGFHRALATLFYLTLILY